MCVFFSARAQGKQPQTKSTSLVSCLERNLAFIPKAMYSFSLVAFRACVCVRHTLFLVSFWLLLSCRCGAGACLAKDECQQGHSGVHTILHLTKVCCLWILVDLFGNLINPW